MQQQYTNNGAFVDVNCLKMIPSQITMATKAVPIFLSGNNNNENGGFFGGRSNEMEAVLQ